MKSLTQLLSVLLLITLTACGVEVSVPTEPAPGTSDQLPAVDNGQQTAPEETLSWQLQAGQSALHFITTKKIHVSELAKLTVQTGTISSQGRAEVHIDLDSVDTANETRDQRLRDLLFETGSYPQAVISAQVDANLLENLNVGAERSQTLAFVLNLHGIEQNLQVPVMVSRLDAQHLLVRSSAPVIVNGLAFGLQAGFDQLKALAGLSSIGTSVPVSFVLVFERVEVQS